MTTDALYRPKLMGQLVVEGLNRYDDRPCLFLGDTVATYKQVRERTSQFAQVLEAKGIGAGSPVAVLSINRPEVLFNMAANMMLGCRGTPLHPLGSLDDHAYVLNDAKIETTRDLQKTVGKRHYYWKITISRGGQMLTTVFGG